MVLQAIVSPSLKILDICTGWPGSVHDQRIFHTSLFSQNLESRLCGVDLEFSVEGFTTVVPENIIGDAGYMQQCKVMTPFGQSELSQPFATSYNDAHSATRKCVERAFGRMKNQWHYLDSECKFYVCSKYFLTIYVCLHNCTGKIRKPNVHTLRYTSLVYVLCTTC